MTSLEPAVPAQRLLAEEVAKNKALFLQNERAFRRVFGINIKPYIDLVTGFDTIKFDDEFIKSGTQSMESVLRQRYGDEGVQIIRKLIEAPEHY